MNQETDSVVGYCGLCCLDCFNHKGEIADLARDLRKKLREAKFDVAAQGLSKYFKDFKEYDSCYQVLGAMVRLRCNRTCRTGGGNPACKARICSRKKEIAGCWECGEFETCTKLDFLKPIHGNANVENLKIIRKKGIQAFLAGKRCF